MRYTRDGSFHRSQNGLLVTSARRAGAFLGGQADCHSARRGLAWEPMECLSVAGGAVATVGVFTFPAGAQLTPEGANRYVAPQGVTANRCRRMRRCTRERLRRPIRTSVQGSLDLIVMQRQAEMMQKALTVFHTEFNKFATEDLPRV